MRVSQWKKELQENMAKIFERKNARTKGTDDESKKIEHLELPRYVSGPGTPEFLQLRPNRLDSACRHNGVSVAKGSPAPRREPSNVRRLRS